MNNFLDEKTNNILDLQIDTYRLNPGQVRLIRTLNTLLAEVLTTMDESTFFDKSAELMRICASIVKLSNFNNNRFEDDTIPYAEQALEYSIDILQEYINNATVVVYDN